VLKQIEERKAKATQGPSGELVINAT